MPEWLSPKGQISDPEAQFLDRELDPPAAVAPAGFFTQSVRLNKAALQRASLMLMGCGIQIGSAQDGSVTYFIPDPDPQGSSSTSEGVAAIGGGAVVYGAEVGPMDFVRYIRN